MYKLQNTLYEKSKNIQFKNIPIYFYILGQSGDYKNYKDKYRLNTFITNILIGYLKCKYANLDINDYMKSIYELNHFLQSYEKICKPLDWSNIDTNNAQDILKNLNTNSNSLDLINELKNLSKTN